MDKRKPSHQSVLKPILVVFGSITLFAYAIVALVSQDARWFLNGAEVPDPQRVVIRVDGEETVLRAPSSDYDAIVQATRKALSSFRNWAPGSMGLSEPTLAEYENRGTILELFFAEPLDFHLPFNDGGPTDLLIPIEGRYAGEGYLFRGRKGRWWAGQLIMSNPQPLLDALSALGYNQ